MRFISSVIERAVWGLQALWSAFLMLLALSPVVPSCRWSYRLCEHQLYISLHYYLLYSFLINAFLSLWLPDLKTGDVSSNEFRLSAEKGEEGRSGIWGPVMRLQLGLSQMSHLTVSSDTKFSHARPAVMRSCLAWSLSCVGECDDVAAVMFWNCGDDR